MIILVRMADVVLAMLIIVVRLFFCSFSMVVKRSSQYVANVLEVSVISDNSCLIQFISCCIVFWFEAILLIA